MTNREMFITEGMAIRISELMGFGEKEFNHAEKNRDSDLKGKINNAYDKAWKAAAANSSRFAEVTESNENFHRVCEEIYNQIK